VQFYSYLAELAGCSGTEEHLSEGATVHDLLSLLYVRYPELARMASSTLVAVGVEYQNRTYVLQDGQEVSLFPPVQGG
jgi:molybdopterin converting factor small subunit